MIRCDIWFCQWWCIHDFDNHDMMPWACTMSVTSDARTITIRFRVRCDKYRRRSINQSRWNGLSAGMKVKRTRVIVIPDEGRSPSEVESGLLCTSIAQEHSPRSILSDSTQRYRTLKMYGVHTRKRGKGGRETERKGEGRSVGRREIPGMTEKEEEGERGKENGAGRGNRLSSESPQNGLFRVCMHVCMYVYLLCVRPTPPSTAHQQIARISYFVRAYTGCHVLFKRGEWYRRISFEFLEKSIETFWSLEKFPLGKTG